MQSQGNILIPPGQAPDRVHGQAVQRSPFRPEGQHHKEASNPGIDRIPDEIEQVKAHLLLPPVRMYVDEASADSADQFPVLQGMEYPAQGPAGPGRAGFLILHVAQLPPEVNAVCPEIGLYLQLREVVELSWIQGQVRAADPRVLVIALWQAGESIVESLDTGPEGWYIQHRLFVNGSGDVVGVYSRPNCKIVTGCPKGQSVLFFGGDGS